MEKPLSLPKRRSARLPEFNYSLCGAYFVTICTYNHRNLFWKPDAIYSMGADIIRPPYLSYYGAIANEAIINIPHCYQFFLVDKYCVMPNHIHMILSVKAHASGRTVSAPTVSTVIGQMKRHVSKQIGFAVWQRSFYDHVIRNEQDYREIWKYIDENPQKWCDDRFFTTPSQ